MVFLTLLLLLQALSQLYGGKTTERRLINGIERISVLIFQVADQSVLQILTATEMLILQAAE